MRKEIALVRLADDEAARLLSAVAEERRDECWWLVRRDGTALPGDFGGGVALLGEVWITRPLARALRALHAAPLVDALDKVVGHNRGRLGRLVPDGPAPRRFP